MKPPFVAAWALILLGMGAACSAQTRYESRPFPEHVRCPDPPPFGVPKDLPIYRLTTRPPAPDCFVPMGNQSGPIPPECQARIDEWKVRVSVWEQGVLRAYAETVVILMDKVEEAAVLLDGYRSKKGDH